MNVSHALVILKNNKKIKYGLIATGLYLFFLVYYLPATLVLSLVNLPGNIVLSSVSGSAWSGQAREIKYASINLGMLRWEIHPLYLLMGKIDADITIRNGQQFINSEVSLGFSGTVELEDTRFLVDIASLQPLTYGMPFSYAGFARGDFPLAFIDKNHYLQFTGQLLLNDLRLTSPRQQVFGDIQVDFSADNDGGSTARISDKGGPLSVSGKLSLDKTALLHLSAKLSSRESGSSLEQILTLFGNKDQAGKVQLNTQFRL